VRILSTNKFLTNFKKVIIHCLPPLITSLLKQVITPRTRKYETFQDALADCNNLGYSDTDIARQVVERTTQLISGSFRNQKFSDSDLRIVLMALIASRNGSIRVLDFGGGAGYHYFLFKTLCPPSTKIDWLVLETQSMVRESQGIKNSELNFKSKIPVNSKDSFDLIIVASSLQYTSNPLTVLQQLIDLNSEFFCLTRTPLFLNGDCLVTVQKSILSAHGPGDFNQLPQKKTVLTPITFLPKAAIVKALESKYGVIQITQDAQSSFQFNGKEIPAFGILCGLSKGAWAQTGSNRRPTD
jgi:putative methyltransferase (TIGR04325 family)